jgi:hypothetical protein
MIVKEVIQGSQLEEEEKEISCESTLEVNEKLNNGEALTMTLFARGIFGSCHQQPSFHLQFKRLLSPTFSPHLSSSSSIFKIPET